MSLLGIGAGSRSCSEVYGVQRALELNALFVPDREHLVKHRVDVAIGEARV